MKMRFIAFLLIMAFMLLSMSSIASAYSYATDYYGPVIYPSSTHSNTYAYGRNGWSYYGNNNYGGYLYPYGAPYGGYGYGGWGRGYGYGTWRGGYGLGGYGLGGYGYGWGRYSSWGRPYWPGYGGVTVAYFYY